MRAYGCLLSGFLLSSSLVREPWTLFCDNGSVKLLGLPSRSLLGVGFLAQVLFTPFASDCKGLNWARGFSIIELWLNQVRRICYRRKEAGSVAHSISEAVRH